MRERENGERAEEEKERQKERQKQRDGGEKKIKVGNGVRYENIRWDVKTVNSGAFVLSPRSSPFSRTRKSTGLMVSFIISYTLAVLSVKVRPKSQPLFTLSPSFLQLSVFQAMFPLSLIPFLMYINRKMLLATCTSKYFTCLRFPIHIFLSND